MTARRRRPSRREFFALVVFGWPLIVWVRLLDAIGRRLEGLGADYD